MFAVPMFLGSADPRDASHRNYGIRVRNRYGWGLSGVKTLRLTFSAAASRDANAGKIVRRANSVSACRQYRGIVMASA